MTLEYMNRMTNLKQKLSKKVQSVEKKKEQIKKMHTEALQVSL